MRSRASFLFPGTLFILSLCIPAAAQRSFPMLWSVYPAGVQRGKTTEVTVYAGGSEGGGGGNLYGAYKALFEGSGVTAEVVPPDKGWPAIDPKKPNEIPAVGEVKLKVTVAPDAALGVREFRIGTPYHGISTVGQLVIGDEPEVQEDTSNADAAHAQSISIPSVVEGKLNQAEKTDYYKIKVTAGEDVTFAVQCARLEDKVHDLNQHADPLLVLTDLNGAELARDDDYYGADPLLHYHFEKAGEYLLQMRDVSYHGNDHWVYRLDITNRPYVIAALPCAVQPGKPAELRLSGFNLGAATAKIDVPAAAPKPIWYAQLKLPNGASNAIPLRVVGSPQTAITDRASTASTNKTVTAALGSASPKAITGTLSLPGGISSWLAAPRQIDRYRFHAKKGEAWGFEVTARRLNSEMDSELKLRDSAGNVQAENDDAIGKDSRIEWTAPNDGDFTIEVRDLAGQAGPTYFYNLTAEKLTPTFTLKCDPGRAMIAPGNRTAWYVQVERKYGFDGDVKVDVNGLPAGVTATPLTLPSGVDQGVIVLTAALDAKQDTSLTEITGTATLPGPDGKPATVTKRAQAQTELYMPGGGRGLYPVDTQGVAVTKTNDIEISIDKQQITLEQGGSAKIEVTVKRNNGYTKPVTLDMLVQHLGSVYTNPLPPGVTIDDGASKTLLGDNETKGYITLKAAGDAKVIKDWPLAVIGNISINFVMKSWFSSPPISLTVVAPAKK